MDFNKVFFRTTSDVQNQLVSALFTVTGFCVTSGQSNDIKIGDVHHIDFNGDYFGFSADR
jgi:hypothetical protein